MKYICVCCKEKVYSGRPYRGVMPGPHCGTCAYLCRRLARRGLWPVFRSWAYAKHTRGTHLQLTGFAMLETEEYLRKGTVQGAPPLHIRYR